MVERARIHHPSPRSAAQRLGVVLFLLGLVAVLVAVPRPASADTSNFTFDSFHAEIGLSRAADGTAQSTVTETIVARFPEYDQNRGIIRAIPDDYQRIPLRTTILSVTDGSGSPLPYEVDHNGGFVEVATGDDAYVRGVQTYVISYTQVNGIRAFADTNADEFYRDINGTGWDQPFGEVSATITVDADISDALNGNTACYYGPEGSTDQCAFTATEIGPGEAATFGIRMTDLGPRENITVAIGFEPGTFVMGEVELTPAEQFATAAAPVFTGGSIVALVASVLAAIGAFFARIPGRDARGRGVIIAEYDPPRETTVLEAANLVHRPTPAGAAAIIDLAVAGHLLILSSDGKDDEVTVEFVAPADGGERQKLLDAIFGAGAARGARARIGADSQDLAKELTDLSSEAGTALRRRGLTEKPARAASVWLIVAAALLLPIAIVSLVFSGLALTVTWVSVAAIIAAGLALAVTIGATRYRDRVTDRGAPIRDHLLGLREYLRLAETDRIRMLQSPEGAERRLSRPVNGDDPVEVLHLYERLLPYAIIFGVEKEWVKEIDTRVRESGARVGWYYGSDFSSVYFLHTLAAMRTATNPASASTSWSSSCSSSGFSGGSMGGGFSGGGFGGGGGGGR